MLLVVCFFEKKSSQEKWGGGSKKFDLARFKARLNYQTSSILGLYIETIP